MTALTGKPATRISYGDVERNLKQYFGAGREVRSIAPADADKWCAWMFDDQGLAGPTISRRIIAARTIFNRAIRWKLVLANPFDGIKAGRQSNEARKCFVSRDDIDAVIAQCPDNEWKTIIALARYGGLRTPSETFALRWQDIDFDRGTMRVPQPKLEHQEGHGHRIVPIFPELREYLYTAFEEAPVGAVYVVHKHRLAGLNLRQQMERFITRARLVQWPKLFHNLRASRETELMRGYDLNTVCRWIGNSPEVAARHYAMSVDLDADFRKAAGLGNKAQQSAENSNCQQVTEPTPETTQPPTE